MKINVITPPRFGGFCAETFTDEYIAASEGVVSAAQISYKDTYQNVARYLVECPHDGYRDRLLTTFPHLIKDVQFGRLDCPRYRDTHTDEILALITYDSQYLIRYVESEEFQNWLHDTYHKKTNLIQTLPVSFMTKLREDMGDEGFSYYVTIVIEFLCRSWEYMRAEDFPNILSYVIEN